jgi:DNA-binding response OmpR family regulator
MTTSESQTVNELYEFGPFRVDAARETLLRAGEPIQLTPKTFQILWFWFATVKRSSPKTT